MAGLNLFDFVPFRLNRLAVEVSSALSSEYSERYGMDIPEWRVLATLGFRGRSCTAQHIVACTRTHKSTISRAVKALLARGIIERTQTESDRREIELRLSEHGRSLYRAMIPRMLRRERELLSCLSPTDRFNLALILGKLERDLELAQENP